METGTGEDRKRGDGGNDNSHCGDGNNDAGDGVIIGFINGIGRGEEEEESLGASGSIGAEWSGAETD